MLNDNLENWNLKYKDKKISNSLVSFDFAKNNPTIIEVLKYIKNGNKVLEIGSGTGELCSYLSSLGFDVSGIDYSEESIKLSNSLKNKFSLNINFIKNNISKIEFPDNSFDIVYGDQVIGHLDDLGESLNEIYRILKPDGLLFLTTANKIRLDGWDLYKLITDKKYKYLQKSFFPWNFKKVITKNGFSFIYGYGDMLFLFRNINLIKNKFFNKKQNIITDQVNRESSKNNNSINIVKKIYYFLDSIIPWWFKITIGGVFKKNEN